MSQGKLTTDSGGPSQELYKRLKEAFHGAPDQEIARRIGVTKQAVSQWKKGTSNPSERQLIRASEITAKSLEWFLTGEDRLTPAFLKIHLPEQELIVRIMNEEFKRVAKLEKKELEVLVKEVAEELGVDVRSIYNFRSGKWPLPAAAVPRLCKRFRSTELLKALLCITLIFTCAISAQQQAPQPSCTIGFQVHILVQYGPDAIPPNARFYRAVSKRPFYLMNADPQAILDKASLPNPELQSYDGTKERRPAGLGHYLSALEGVYGGSSHLRPFYEKASKLLDHHIVQKTETNRQGKASFLPVPTGTYFIVGSGSPHPQIWNVKVRATSSSTHVILDEKNAL